MDGETISPANLWRSRRTAREVRSWLGADPRRVFHGHSRAGLLVGLWLDAWGERRCVVSVHCYGRRRWFYRWASRRLGDRLFWLSPAMRTYYRASGTGWAGCIPGGVPRRFLDLKPAAPQADKLRLGGIGSRVRWKRWELVPAALRALDAPGVTFEQIGDEPDADYGRELRSCGVPGVRWSPAEPDSRHLLGRIDLLVCPSHREPFSMAMQEALASGVPVLAAASGGSLDLIAPGVNGWLFADGSAEALTGRLAELVATRAWEDLDRRAVRKSAWDAARVAEQWSRVYARLRTSAC